MGIGPEVSLRALAGLGWEDVVLAGRWAKPADFGGAAVFLASEASDYVHGAVLPVDGGWLAR